jgi:hypothetical protein
MPATLANDFQALSAPGGAKKTALAARSALT